MVFQRDVCPVSIIYMYLPFWHQLSDIVFWGDFSDFLGSGKWPDKDPWDKEFSNSYFPDWARCKGEWLASGWRGVLDGVQGDADWLHKTFNFNDFRRRNIF